MDRDLLRERLDDLEDCRKAVERELANSRNRQGRLRILEEAREFCTFGGPFWEEVAKLDDWTRVCTPHGEWTVRVPLEDQKQSVRNILQETRLAQLKKASPKERNALYRRLRVRVEAYSNRMTKIEVCTPGTTTHAGKRGRSASGALRLSPEQLCLRNPGRVCRASRRPAGSSGARPDGSTRPCTALRSSPGARPLPQGS